MAASLRVGTNPADLSDVPVEPDDVKWGLMDISASDSGRVQDTNATMYKNRVTQKRKISLSWMNPSMADTSTILKAFNPEYVYVQYLDPLENAFRIGLFYVGDRSSPFRQITLNNADGTRTVMKSLSFDIIER